MKFKDEMLELTKSLISIPSMNSVGDGEKNVALFIENYLRQIPYFEQHPENVIVQPLKDDRLDRRNVFALITGELAENHDTILLHGHIDTVGVDDFGTLAPYAFSPEELTRQLAKLKLPDEVSEDLASGDWLFGRGACDMKSGDAVFMVLAKYFGSRVKEFSGNLLLSFNPVEENLHTGIIEGLEILEKLKEERNLHYLFAINNDYTCPLFPGDTTRYVYSGAAGKLLPCFYIAGQETHVGQCFEGFDASQTAAELVRQINLNSDFCDGSYGEYTLPPTTLKLRDLKSCYNVQTASSAFVYFNYFVHSQSVPEISDKLKAAAARALDNVSAERNEQYRRFCELTKIENRPFSYNTRVLLYSELYQMVKHTYSGDLDKHIEEMAVRLRNDNMDMREIAMAIVKELCELIQVGRPCIVLFFAAPYCPHNTLHPENPAQASVHQKLEGILTDFASLSGENFQLLHYFQSLSDSSYLSIDDDEESIHSLIDNFPAYQTLYPIPLEQIKRVNIPAVNYGVFGKDAHKWTERVCISYSFETLPDLLLHTIQTFFPFK